MRYAYDAFGNRTGLREGERETRYTYNALNQLVSLTDGETTEKYAYDKRGNLTEHLRNGALANQYLYGALNRLEKAVNGEGIEASYQYNGLGYRTGKSIRESLPDPEKQVRYTIDLTRQYHNLLQKEEEGEILSFLWDGGAAGMRPEKPEYYLRDDLGSPIRLLGENGELTESYGYDEFGRDLYGNQGEVQPFGYTGYQYDRVSDTYFAQAREYVPDVGRFVETDIILGAIQMPITMNRYSYCFNNGLILVDLNGAWPATRDAFDGLKGFCQNIDEKLYDINQGINRGLSTVEQRLDSMLDGIERGLDNISSGLYNVKTEIKNTANNVAEEAKELWENNKSKIADFMYENKAGIISALAIVVAGVFGFATGGAGLALIAVISLAASGGIAGALNFVTGGNFINGFAGGAVTTTLSMTGLPIWAAAGIGAAVTTVLNNTDIGNAWYLDVLEKTADAMALAIILPFSKIGKLIDVPLNGVESLVMNYFLQVYEAGVNLIIEFIEEIKKNFFRTSVMCDET